MYTTFYFICWVVDVYMHYVYVGKVYIRVYLSRKRLLPGIIIK
jgi:hypothetical protein